jgi:drug/metabolite transporter (DMT)-like permease
MVMYTLGSRVIPAAELTLLSLIEVLLGPLWVFLVLGETASATTFVGGGVLLAAVALNAAMGTRAQMAEGVAKAP